METNPILLDDLGDWQQFTNNPELWVQLNLNELNCALWSVAHNPNDEGDLLGRENIEQDVSEFGIVDINYIKHTKSWNDSRYIFIVGQESFCGTWTKFKSNIYVFDSTFIPSEPRFIPYFYWLGIAIDVELNVNYYNKLVNYKDKVNDNKCLLFDVLIGNYRPHRKYTADYINNNHLSDCVLLSDHSSNNTQTHIPGTELVEENNGINMYATDEFVLYNKLTGATASVFCFIPYLIYNKTLYTVVTETRFDRIFLTEKTAKPILAERLFIMIGAQHTLKHMRAMGFKTFGSVINEDYDNEPNNEKRYDMALKQMELLCTANHHDVLTTIQSIVKHNRKFLINECNWDMLPNGIAKVLNQ